MALSISHEVLFLDNCLFRACTGLVRFKDARGYEVKQYLVFARTQHDLHLQSVRCAVEPDEGRYTLLTLTIIHDARARTVPAASRPVPPSDTIRGRHRGRRGPTLLAEVRADHHSITMNISTHVAHHTACLPVPYCHAYLWHLLLAVVRTVADLMPCSSDENEKANGNMSRSVWFTLLPACVRELADTVAEASMAWPLRQSAAGQDGVELQARYI